MVINTEEIKSKTRLEAALEYAARGWAVLPISANGKAPACAHGVKDATTDREQIERWWKNDPNFNIGIAAGKRSGIIVFDIDPRNGGSDSWSEWVSEYGLPHGLRQSSAGGGHHYIAEYREGVRSRLLRPGVDVLSDGKYFLAAPSSIGGNSYRWDNDDQPFAIPAEWIEGLTTTREPQERSQHVQEIHNGQRNQALTSLAGSLRHLGLCQAEILAAISTTNRERCSEPLPESEVQKIAASVARYEPERDVIASAAIGNDAAETILQAGDTDSKSWLIPASEFCAGVKPIKYLIKGFLPRGSLTMVHGPSGVGKSFAVCDWSWRIAGGIAEWQGCKVESGPVVILAGEGHAGLRGRMRAWMQHHSVESLDCYVSQAGVALDTAVGIEQALTAIAALPIQPVLVVVDTLHAHMTGDENHAKDAGAMLGGCRQIMDRFGCAVLLVHHTGNSDAAQHRARGSSAWRAALDIECSVKAVRDTRVIEQTKNKDAEPTKPKGFTLEKIEIDGWFDDEGEPITSAVAIPCDPPQQAKVGSKLNEHKRMFESAWFASGAEIHEGQPYISRHSMVNYLTTQRDLGTKTASEYIRPGRKGKPIADLLEEGLIVLAEHGWSVVDNPWSSVMLLQRKGSA